jgi:hypothetical protein
MENFDYLIAPAVLRLPDKGGDRDPPEVTMGTLITLKGFWGGGDWE